MQIADQGQSQPTEAKPANNGKKSRFALETITDAASAKKAARKGALGGLIFAGMYALGGIFFAAGYSPVNGQQDLSFQKDFIVYLITEVLLVALILFFTWRISTGRGYISATLLALWFVVEVVMKIANGTTNAGWAFFHFIVFMCMIDGVRGSWLGRKYRKESIELSAKSGTGQSKVMRS